jgi:CheY-like chemotaxis protein
MVLQIATREVTTAAGTVELPPDDVPMKGPLQVLVVDDDDDLRALARAHLEAAGFGVIEARDGREALAVLFDPNQREPAVIVLDMSMPGMSGQQFLAVLGGYWRLRRIPVVILAAELPEENEASRLAVERLKKPQQWNEIVDAVKRHCAGRGGEPADS